MSAANDAALAFDPAAGTTMSYVGVISSTDAVNQIGTGTTIRLPLFRYHYNRCPHMQGAMNAFSAASAFTPDGFALAFPARDATDTRSELGARFDRAFGLYPNAVLALCGRIAWAHDWVSDPTLMPLFQSLPGSSFIVKGATPAKDSAGADLRLVNGITPLAKFDGEFASHSSTYTGTGTIRYSWFSFRGQENTNVGSSILSRRPLRHSDD